MGASARLPNLEPSFLPRSHFRDVHPVSSMTQREVLCLVPPAGGSLAPSSCSTGSGGCKYLKAAPRSLSHRTIFTSRCHYHPSCATLHKVPKVHSIFISEVAYPVEIPMTVTLMIAEHGFSPELYKLLSRAIKNSLQNHLYIDHVSSARWHVSSWIRPTI